MHDRVGLGFSQRAAVAFREEWQKGSVLFSCILLPLQRPFKGAAAGMICQVTESEGVRAYYRHVAKREDR